MAKFEEKSTIYPGPRKVIKLDISEIGFEALIKGTNVERVWIEPEHIIGLFSLHADGTAGETRDNGVKPATDVLVQAANDFNDVFSEYEDQIPEPVIEAFNAMVERWMNYQGEEIDDDDRD